MQRLFFLVFLSLLAQAASVNAQSSFSQSFNSANGFYDYSIYAILKDSRGFMWLGTSNGLFRYDGYRFLAYTSDKKDSTTLSDNFVRAIAEDKNGYLWIGTLNGGLSRLNFRTNKVERFNNPADSVFGKEVRSLAVDQAGDVWIAADGLHRYDSRDLKFEHFYPEQSHPSSLRHRLVSEVFVDRRGTVWCGYAGDGFSQWIQASRTFRHYRNFHTDPMLSERSNVVRSITDDQDGNIWVGTYGGLLRLDAQRELLRHWTNDETNPQSLAHNSIWDIRCNADGRVYIATWGGGLSCYNTKSEQFENELFRESSLFKINSTSLTSLFLENDHKLWVGTNNAGLYQVSLLPAIRIFPKPAEDAILRHTSFDGKTFYFFYENFGLLATDSALHEKFRIPISDGKNGFNAKQVFHCADDNNGFLWMATDNGLFRYHYRTKAIRQFKNDPTDDRSLTHNNVYTVIIDSKGRLWVGTPWGLDLFEPKAETFIHWRRPLLQGANVYRILESDSGLWLGTISGGLTHLNLERRSAIHFQNDPLNSKSVSGNFIKSIKPAENGKIWVATNNGLDMFDPATREFFHAGVKEGFSGISTARLYTLSRSNQLVVETVSGFFQSIHGSNEAELQFERIVSPIKLDFSVASAGEYIFLEDEKSQSVVNFSDLLVSSDIPQIAITGFGKDLNEEGLSSSRILNPEALLSHEATLRHDEDLIWLEFSVLDFHNPAANQYAYKLEGFDHDWVHSGTRRFVTYTNLPAGDYTFRVKGSNAFGVWNEAGASFAITVLPAPWQTWWAYTLYGMGVMGLLWAGRRAVINRERLKAQQAIDQKEKDTLLALDRLKTKFFSNITHEFRTPLTLIQGPAEELSSESLDERTLQHARMIKSNSIRLLKLVNQLLDLAKLDANEMQLAYRPVQLDVFLRTILSQFTSLAVLRGIQFEYQVPSESTVVSMDDEKVETILNNLISNALKFTPRGGRIQVSISFRNNLFAVEVNDTGRGIPAERIPHIFDRFYQVEATDSSHSEGTGIGLALVKEYVELMKGMIHVESVVNMGTRMQVSFSLSPSSESATSTVGHTEEKLIPAEETVADDEELPWLLIVEDNEDIRSLIKISLGNGFRYLEAADGVKGLDLARREIPDLIVSDLMMPEMDGMELCQEIRKDNRTNHIPFIMLTAKAAEESKLEGLQTGADDYLVKPFNKHELLLKIQNMVTLRKNLQARMKINLLAQSAPVQATSAGEQFVLKARQFVEVHMKDDQLSVELLAAEMNLSREQCYRKIISLTGMSPTLFIRKIRLQKASQLLEAKWGPVSQVAYEVGFDNLSYFSKSFKEEFGKLPSEF